MSQSLLLLGAWIEIVNKFEEHLGQGCRALYWGCESKQT